MKILTRLAVPDKEALCAPGNRRSRWWHKDKVSITSETQWTFFSSTRGANLVCVYTRGACPVWCLCAFRLGFITGSTVIRGGKTRNQQQSVLVSRILITLAPERERGDVPFWVIRWITTGVGDRNAKFNGHWERRENGALATCSALGNNAFLVCGGGHPPEA